MLAWAASLLHLYTQTAKYMVNTVASPVQCKAFSNKQLAIEQSRGPKCRYTKNAKETCWRDKESMYRCCTCYSWLAPHSESDLTCNNLVFPLPIYLRERERFVCY